MTKIKLITSTSPLSYNLVYSFVLFNNIFSNGKMFPDFVTIFIAVTHIYKNDNIFNWLYT